LYRGVIAICASALVVFSVWFGFMGIQKLVSILVV
jgi:hypothetical protein